jgi:hypothetical protein
MKKMNKISVIETLKKAKDVFNNFFKEKEYNPWGADILLMPETELSPSSILFTVKKEEMMRISEEGFFWKGKLVENDKEIYSIVKEFFIKVVGDYDKKQ